MNLTELAAEVYTLTNRPDLVTETQAALRAATLKLHGIDYFWPDIVEVQIEFELTSYVQQLEYNALFPRWRALKYLRVIDTSQTPNAPGKFITLIQPEFVLDEYHTERLDVVYGAGQFYNMKLSTQEKSFLLGYYEWPDLNPPTYRSWIADKIPWAIINEAASHIFKSIGYDEQYVRFQTLNQEHINMIKTMGIVAQGY